jgi:metal-dependent HD superfamily phosphatase/phosphodiesterase
VEIYRVENNEPRRIPMKVDVKVRNEGTLWQFFMLTKAAKAWVEENVQMESYMRQGETAFAAEHRYGPPLVDGMRDAGLVVAPY